MFKNGRSDRIRTCGLLVPNQAHYQTVPHPDLKFVSLFFVPRFTSLVQLVRGPNRRAAICGARLRTYQTVPHPDLKFVCFIVFLLWFKSVR